MNTYQSTITCTNCIDKLDASFESDLILLFVSPSFENAEEAISRIKKLYPNTTIAGCSTSGEIINTNVDDGSIAFNAIKFEKTEHKLVSVNINDFQNSEEAGKKLRQKLQSEKLKHVLVFSDGLNVNGADLVYGMNSINSENVTITGGLAGDGSDFVKTFTINNGAINENEILGLGFYGDDLKVGYGSKGGWDSFGIERNITKSDKNVLYELDGQPALQLYKSFLGEKAKELPGSGLLFPLSLRVKEGELPVVRTILSVNEEEQSLTFAGNVPEGSYARLMKANVDHLIDGAEDSAKITQGIVKDDAEFALLISCVGRRLVLDQMVEEEVEAVRDVLGERPKISGFYSYGELAPFGEFNPCQLHNQTMTITTFSES